MNLCCRDIQAPVIQLASEFNVGFELVSKCTSYQYEASERCIGREPFTFYGDSATGCQDYFWCSPEHGACTFTCSTGVQVALVFLTSVT